MSVFGMLGNACLVRVESKVISIVSIASAARAWRASAGLTTAVRRAIACRAGRGMCRTVPWRLVLSCRMTATWLKARLPEPPISRTWERLHEGGGPHDGPRDTAGAAPITESRMNAAPARAAALIRWALPARSTVGGETPPGPTKPCTADMTVPAPSSALCNVTRIPDLTADHVYRVLGEVLGPGEVAGQHGRRPVVVSGVRVRWRSTCWRIRRAGGQTAAAP